MFTFDKNNNMKNLIQMVDYVIDTYKEESKYMLNEVFANKVHDYAKLLNSKPTLSMFVACDDEGNVLEEPINYDVWVKLDKTIGFTEHEKYQTALSKVIFEGWELKWISEDKDDVALYNAEKSLTAQFRLWRNNEVEFDYKIITTLSDLTKFNLKLKYQKPNYN